MATNYNTYEQSIQSPIVPKFENDHDKYEDTIPSSDTPLYGYVSADEPNNSLYGAQEPVYAPSSHESNYNLPSTYNSYPVETPSVEENILNSFKTIISRFKEAGVGEKWAPLATSSI